MEHRGQRDGRNPKGHRGELRDAKLGRELRALDVPEHSPAFFERLEARIQEEEAAKPRSASTLSRRADSRVPWYRRRWLRLSLLPIPLAAMILASVWVFADRIGPDQLAPQPATAADVKAKVATAMTDLKALGGTLIVTVPTGVSNEKPHLTTASGP